jgi:adenine-specific DNA-methyltransferase
MRFIGNKENIIEKIYHIVKDDIQDYKSFFDFFAGTTNVGRFFKKLDYQVYSSDLLYFSYVLQRAYIVNDEKCQFIKLLSKINVASKQLFASPIELVVEYLNNIKPVKGFIFQHYTPMGSSHLPQPRMYFSDENGEIIDAIRQQIEKWKEEELINDSEYFVLLACLIETVPFYANVSGVFGAFHKKWDVRAIKRLRLRTIEFVTNNKTNFCYNQDSVNLLETITADVFYLDPPYNQRQYAPNYHILETIARYDNPVIKGVTGLRPYENEKSKFCNAEAGLKELAIIAEKGKFKTLILSYNSEGIMPKEKILEVFEKYGDVKLIEFEYLRFKSNNNGDSKHKKYIYEQLYILKK